MFIRLTTGLVLWEETHVLKVVGSNPRTIYWMNIFHIPFRCNNYNACLKRRKRGWGWPIYKKVSQYGWICLNERFQATFSSCFALPSKIHKKYFKLPFRPKHLQCVPVQIPDRGKDNVWEREVLNYNLADVILGKTSEQFIIECANRKSGIGDSKKYGANISQRDSRIMTTTSEEAKVRGNKS